MGIIPEAEYTGNTMSLTGGERVVFVTDGCYEWDRHDHDSGWEQFVDYMDINRTTPPSSLWDGLIHRIHEQHGTDLEDDCTLITLDIPK